MLQYKRLIDISQPVKNDSAVFPGDTPYKREIVLTYEQSKIVNLTSFSMSPHVGTHVDAPSHIKGDMSADAQHVGSMPLEPFIGKVLVVNLAPLKDGITINHLSSVFEKYPNLPERMLFRTQEKIRYDVFEDEYSFFTPELARELYSRGVRLVGIDTPSADHIRSKTLDAHHELDSHGMTWLENLDLTQVKEGEYYLIAFPVKFMELEAAPVRAVLLEF
jgi:arylformamidase